MRASERAVLDRLREVYCDFPAGRVVQSESPDFMVKKGRKYVIGIEITSLPERSYEVTPSSRNHFHSELNGAILKKIGKLRLYQKKVFNEYWLVVHADTLTVKLTNFETLIGKAALENGYDRVLLLAMLEGKVWELNAGF